MQLPTSSSAALTSISLLLVFIVPSHCQQFEGDACRVNGASGVCRLLPDCAPVYNELLAGNPPGHICGFSSFDPIVCCPKNTGSSTSTTTTTTTTTTARPVPTRGPIDGRGAVARAKCEEYAGSVYALEVPQTLSANRQPVNISLCTLKTRKLIVGGKKADPKEFPHMAAVGYNAREAGILWLCGGTLISERFVLTAAHCTYSPDWGSAAWVRLGDLNLARSDDDAKPRNVQIAERIRHPRYKRPSEYHDIALLKLESAVRFNAWIRPACLPYSLPDTGYDNKAVATGWGRVDWADDEGSNDLLKVTLNLVPQPRCNSSFADGISDGKLKFGIVDDWQVCAGELGKDTCQGDSGGPLAIRNNDYNCMYSVVGITSLGRLCGSIIPGVYTRVYYYISWIESVVWPDSL